MIKLKQLILLVSAFILAACGKTVDLSIPLDKDFTERLENYLSGTGSIDSLFFDKNPSKPATSLLEWAKRTVSKEAPKQTYVVASENAHLERLIGSDATLYFSNDKFYRFSGEVDGFVILKYEPMGGFSIGFYQHDNGRLYVPDLTEVESPSAGVSPPITYLRFSFEGIEHMFDENSTHSKSPIAEIQLKNSVFGIPYESRHGVFTRMGSFVLPARGVVHEAKINYFTDCDGVKLEFLKGKQREKISEKQSNNLMNKGDSETFKFQDTED